MNSTVVIPSLNPDEKILTTIQSLIDAGFDDIVLVDDGSDANHKKLFRDAASLKEVSLLTHDVNKGKGQAMKTAFTYIKNNRPNHPSVITVDGDGQHLTKDVIKCIEKLEEKPDSFVMGVRNFNQDNVPARSRFGNNVTKVVFNLLCGIKVSDTQTGLRAFSFDNIDKMIAVDGSRYEYEANQLFAVKNAGIPFSEVVIETVYLDDNQTSHFRPIRDSIRIYGVIIKYIASSFASFLVDISLFTLFNFILGYIGISSDLRLFLATAMARLVSSFVNFSINRKVVFKSQTGFGKTMIKYYILAVCQMCASFGLVFLFSSVIFKLDGESFFDTLIKFAVDTFLFFVSFRIQQNWVFVSRRKKQ